MSNSKDIKKKNAEVKGKLLSISKNKASVENERFNPPLQETNNCPPSYDENYLQNLIKKAKSSWSDVKDADEWLKQIRHGK